MADFFFSSRRRHTRCSRDWSSDVCSSDLAASWQSGVVDQRAFDSDFDWAFFRNDGDQIVKAVRALGSVRTQLGLSASTDELFWREPFSNAFVNQARASADKVRQMRLSVEDSQQSLLQNQLRARRNRSMIPAMAFAAQRFDHLGRRMQVVIKFSDQYWNAYLN